MKEEMHGAVTCPVCANGVLLKDGDVDYCSVCGTVFKTVKVVKQDVTQFDRAEALDRIHVIQTMLSALLTVTHVQMNGVYSYHRGLSEDAAELVSEAMEKLCEAYQMQGAFVFEEEEGMNEKLTRQVWRFMKGAG